MRGAGDAFAHQGEHLGEQPIDLVGDGYGRPERLLHDKRTRHRGCNFFLVRTF